MFYLKYDKNETINGEAIENNYFETFTNQLMRDQRYNKLKLLKQISNIEVWQDAPKREHKVEVCEQVFCKARGIELTLHFKKKSWTNKIALMYHDATTIHYFLNKKCSHGNFCVVIPNQPSAINRLFNETDLVMDNDPAMKIHCEHIKKHYANIKQIQDAHKYDEFIDIEYTKYIRNYELLRPYQRSGVKLLQKYNSFGLFGEQRTGKTPPTVIGTLHHKKILIAVPSGHQENWRNEYNMGSKRGSNVRLLKGGVEKRKKMYEKFHNAESIILIGSFTTIAKDCNIIRETINSINMLILDEAHFLRHTKSRRSQGMNKVRRIATHAVALTGTPATNMTSDVIPLLRFINPHDRFLNTLTNSFYFQPVKNYYSGGYEYNEVRTESEKLWQEMYRNYTYILKLYEVNKFIPETIHMIVSFNLNKSQETAYQEMLRNYRYFNKSGKCMRAANNLTRLIRLRQISIDPAILDIRATSAKTEWLNYFLNSDEEAGNKVIIWSASKAYLKILKDTILPKALLFTGELTPVQKQKMSTLFRESKKAVMLVNIKAGATGGTWPCDTMIFMDRDGNPVLNRQADARGIEPNKPSDKPLIIYDTKCTNGFDKFIDYANDRKVSQSHMANNLDEIYDDITDLMECDKNKFISETPIDFKGRD